MAGLTQIQQHHKEVLVVIEANAARVKPLAVMIHFQNARPALPTMMGPFWLPIAAFGAVKNTRILKHLGLDPLSQILEKLFVNISV